MRLGAAETKSMQNVLDDIEAELVGDPIFGDTRRILVRVRTFLFMVLQAAPPNRTMARAICHELESAPGGGIEAPPAVSSLIRLC